MEKGGRLHFPVYFWLPKKKNKKEKGEGINMMSVDEGTSC